MKIYWWWKYSCTILELTTGWRQVVSFMPLPLYLRETASSYPSCSRQGDPQSQAGHYGREKNLLSCPGIKHKLLGHPAHSLVIIPTELSWLAACDLFSVVMVMNFCVIIEENFNC
jgi:hypothetical protein